MSSLYLHIGYHRTGTTYFQSFVSANRENMLNSGCLVPNTGYDGQTHSGLALCLPSERQLQIRNMRMTGGRGFTQTPFQQGLAVERYRQLGNELEENPAEFALATSECFLEWVDVGYLGRLFQEIGIAPQIVVLVRRQDRWIESVYSQVIRDSQLAYAGTFQALPQHSLLDFNEVIGPWIQHFGKKNVHVRFYEEGAGPAETSLAILSALKLNAERLGVEAWGQTHPIENASLDECCVEVQRVLNRKGHICDSARDIINEASQSFEARKLFRKWRLSRLDAEKFMRNFKTSNERFFESLAIAPRSDWGSVTSNSSAELRRLKYSEIVEELAPVVSRSTLREIQNAIGTERCT